MSALKSLDASHPVYGQQEEYKASYDDLIDEYATPYTANSRHQTFTLATPGSDGHRGGSSVPLGSKIMSSKQSDDTSHEPSSHAYPPLPPVKESDPRSLWQKVRFRWLCGKPRSSHAPSIDLT
jgi:hypothetical protein